MKVEENRNEYRYDSIAVKSERKWRSIISR